jgi:hypothetical protein
MHDWMGIIFGGQEKTIYGNIQQIIGPDPT